ncbi:hypothetical protein BJ138DRAFT_1153720 [Hygrophoropsis aurantiaca]|uniref:Uncharacterized protein n=1 Tax=Hygrophoropsis aurantiaca TaxID=72124 RepID=A0ACB8AA13_9AGAM|nr:hypothetical protein BJ138DRAFT_1153720 [Hygrophoropsis aurantiaca]
MPLLLPSYFFTTAASKLRWCTKVTAAIRELLENHSANLVPSDHDTIGERYDECLEMLNILSRDYSVYSSWSPELWDLVNKCRYTHNDLECAVHRAGNRSRPRPETAQNDSQTGSADMTNTNESDSRSQYATARSNNTGGSSNPTGTVPLRSGANAGNNGRYSLTGTEIEDRFVSRPDGLDIRSDTTSPISNNSPGRNVTATTERLRSPGIHSAFSDRRAHGSALTASRDSETELSPNHYGASRATQNVDNYGGLVTNNVNDYGRPSKASSAPQTPQAPAAASNDRYSGGNIIIHPGSTVSEPTLNHGNNGRGAQKTWHVNHYHA